MPTVPNALGYRFGIAKQTNESTPVATADAMWQVWAGELQSSVDDQALAVADINNMVPGWFRKGARWGGSLTVGAFMDTAGAIFKHFLGADAVSGAGPYTHKISVADPNNDWLQFWQLRPDGTGPGLGLWERFEAGMIDSVEIVWGPGEPVKLVLTMMGKTVTVGTAPTLTNTIFDAYQTNAFTYNGGVSTAYPSAVPVALSSDYVTSIQPTTPTLMIDFATATAATTVTYLESGSLKITRELEYIQTSALTPTYRKHGKIDVALSATALFESYSQYRQTYYGGGSGTTLSQVIPIGALSFAFNGQTGTGTRILMVTVPNQVAALGSGVGTTPSIMAKFDPPAMDPNAGAVRHSISSLFSKTAAGDSIGVKVISDINVAYP